MTKIAVGIGEEFPAGDSKPAEAPDGDRRADQHDQTQKDARCAARREAYRKWREYVCVESCNRIKFYNRKYSYRYSCSNNSIHRNRYSWYLYCNRNNNSNCKSFACTYNRKQ